ncbi:hypothetical protein [Mucilaginibacter ginsenosidivorans]|uniref:M56 family metallopeptidase n=1 Tax=Mucilaginibacter ginsenosidivorans TaxID=398053 RepID=A0A5B8V2E5_9SPHI|nr:hypothetical protein [Mucilaginibacter ginsenosidivorans]QEC64851.1 hypothetical protein FRZ54_20535 [Mucilaginibacter ginsenosidivorans]
MNWLHYLLESNLYLIIFFGFYYLVLRRETWYQYNRIYLLFSSGLAFIIPFVQAGILKPQLSPAPAGRLTIQQIDFSEINAAPPSLAIHGPRRIFIWPYTCQ